MARQETPENHWRCQSDKNSLKRWRVRDGLLASTLEISSPLTSRVNRLRLQHFRVNLRTSQPSQLWPHHHHHHLRSGPDRQWRLTFNHRGHLETSLARSLPLGRGTTSQCCLTKLQRQRRAAFQSVWRVGTRGRRSRWSSMSPETAGNF